MHNQLFEKSSFTWIRAIKAVPFRKWGLLGGIAVIFLTTAALVKVDKEDLMPVHAGTDAVVKDEMIKQDLVGMAVAVIKDGNIIHCKGYGYSDLGSKKKVTISTPFRWASISKTLTAVATLKLIEENKLSLNTYAHSKSNWPSSGEKGKVRVKHLLSNRSGINHYDEYTRNNYSNSNSSFNADQCVNVFKNADLLFDPDDKYEYSTFGFNLLGAIVDDASPSGYLNYVNSKIANKVGGMPSLKASRSTRKGYRKFCDGQVTSKSISSVEWKLPGGGWESNISDLAKFAEGLLEGKFLNDTDKLWTEVDGNDKYCYGINRIGSSTSSNMRVWHGGAHDNARSILYLYPNSNLGIVILSNNEFTDVYRVVHHIADLFGKSWNDPHNATNSCKEDKNCSGSFAAIWRKTNKEVIIRRGLKHNEFYDEWKELRSAGYYCDDFEAYVKSGTLYWDGIFRKGSGGNAIWRNFDYDGFKAKWEEQSGKGYRLVDLETYVVNGKRKWAGLFRPGTGKYAMYRGQTTDSFGDKRKELAGKGYKLIDVEAYTSSGKLRWAGVWVAGTDGPLNRNYDTKAFGDLVKDRRNKGYRLIDIEAYRVSGTLKWAGIWEKSSKGDYINRNYNYCDLMQKHNDREPDGYEMLDLERY